MTDISDALLRDYIPAPKKRSSREPFVGAVITITVLAPELGTLVSMQAPDGKPMAEGLIDHDLEGFVLHALLSFLRL